MPVGRNKVDLMQLGNLVAGNMQRKRERQQQAMQFQQQMQLRKQQMAQTEAASARSHELALERANAYYEGLNIQNKINAETFKKQELTAKFEEKRTEALGIMAAEVGLEGVSQYEKGKAWGEHPGIQEAGLGATVLQMQEDIAAFTPEAVDPFDRAVQVYKAGASGLSWEGLQQLVPGISDNFKGALETGVADKERGVTRDDLDIEKMLVDIGYTKKATKFIGARAAGGAEKPAIDIGAIFGEREEEVGGAPVTVEAPSIIGGVAMDDMRALVQMGIDKKMAPNEIVGDILTTLLERNPLLDPQALSAQIGRLVLEMTGSVE